ncbi:MAG: Fic family protein, partial [Chloroflexi bacterium]|nr:Fic family protein [Chloroflexota bacterium]
VFVPPPAPDMQKALGELEVFLRTETHLPPLVEAALLHYQFEAIHPFLDGNGRIGRLLTTLFLCQRAILTKPLLYLSAFFERYRQEYYRLLLGVSQEGAWREWIEFFLRAVAGQSTDAGRRARRFLDLQSSYSRIAREKRFSPTAVRLVELVFMRPVITARTVQESLSMTFPAAQKAINALVAQRILAEVTGAKRNKAYRADEVLQALEEETSPEEPDARSMV